MDVEKPRVESRGVCRACARANEDKDDRESATAAGPQEEGDMKEKKKLTTNAGAPVPDNQNLSCATSPL